MDEFKKILILGVGNPLRRDDGIGPHVIATLKQKELPVYIELVDGGTDGLGLIEYLRSYAKIVLVDAVDMKEAPGTVKVVSLDQIRMTMLSDALSTHGFGLAEVISMAEGLGIKFDMQIVAIQPENIDFEGGLTETLQSKSADIIHVVLETVEKMN